VLPDDENPGLLEVQTTVPPHVHPQVLVGVLHAQAEGGVGHPFYHQTCSFLKSPIIKFLKNVSYSVSDHLSLSADSDPDTGFYIDAYADPDPGFCITDPVAGF